MKILSIDGGGARGLSTAQAIATMEKELGVQACDAFDLIVGTSVGGIIACALSIGIPASDVVELLKVNLPYIFPNSPLRFLKGLVFPKYEKHPLKEACTQALGSSKRLSETECKLIIPSYEINMKCPFFFRSDRATSSREYDFYLADVALATSAAPTYFTPTELAAQDGSWYTCIDGGVYANDPTMVGIAEALARHKVPLDQISLVSIGTGGDDVHIEMSSNWGLSAWAGSILSVILDGITDTVSFQASQLLGNRYVRVDPKVKGKLDKINEKLISEYISEGSHIMKENISAIRGII